MLLAAEALRTPEAFERGWVELDGEVIAALGHGAPPRTPDAAVPVIAPGLVDAHCHGGGGSAFDDATDAALAAALGVHRAHGTTTTVASLVTAPPDDLLRQVDFLAGWVERGELAGIHIEGPWLAPGKKGAHEASLLASPTPDAVAAVLDAGRGTIRMVTLAPELPHADEAIKLITDAGAVVAIGHTMASHAQACAAIDRGARGGTHLFNAMPPLGHRDPGPILALLGDERVTCELIYDGVHVDADLCAYVLRQHPGRVALITDAMAAAGCADGTYNLGPLQVRVTAGVARRADDGAIAGSTLFLAVAVARAVAHGVRPEVALDAATVVPARYLGLDAGRLRAGGPADLAVLDERLVLKASARRGEWTGEIA